MFQYQKHLHNPSYSLLDPSYFNIRNIYTIFLTLYQFLFTQSFLFSLLDPIYFNIRNIYTILLTLYQFLFTQSFLFSLLDLSYFNIKNICRKYNYLSKRQAGGINDGNLKCIFWNFVLVSCSRLSCSSAVSITDL